MMKPNANDKLSLDVPEKNGRWIGVAFFDCQATEFIVIHINNIGKALND